ncbi:MAG: calcineurin-like phosphoesterase C-terminal domain-containing protein, partial [Pirellula sp.]
MRLASFPTLAMTLGLSLSVSSLVFGQQSQPRLLGELPVTGQAKGYVYWDQNGNGLRDSEEKGLEGIRVSNGFDVVKTNADGLYSLDVSDDTILFVIKPRNWMPPLNELNLPKFYYIHKPKGSPQSQYSGVAPTGELLASIDFPLLQQQEPDQFKVILFGDTQPRNKQEVDFMAHDIIPQIKADNVHGAAFGITLGDVVFDDLNVYGPHNEAVALLDKPWYNVLGNHDLNYDSPNDRLADETFEKTFGPAYYSFDYGPVHFVTLDDVKWIGATATEKGRYVGGIGKDQLEFLKKDLASIPIDQPVVLLMHIPIIEAEDRLEFYKLIENRPFAISFAAHTHFLKHHFIGKDDGWNGKEPHHHLVNVTVCGSWWRGSTDELGIPHATMSDGGANGYSILSLDKNSYKLEYRAARRPASHQMSIYLPDEIPADQISSTTMVVNVFNGSKRSKVEYRLVPEGAWTVMERFDG